MELKHIFMDPAHPQAGCLTSILSPEQLQAICDEREGWNSPTYRLNDTKLKDWLMKKVSQLSSRLSQMQSFQSVVPLSAAVTEGNPFVKDAIGLLSEYLCKAHFELLLTAHGLPLDALVVKKRSQHDVTTADADTTNFRPTPKAKEKPAASVTKLATINTKGMKSLSSYFGGSPSPAKKAKK